MKSRRQFIESSVLGSASLMVPAFMKKSQGFQRDKAKAPILVVIQLSGGNDGLNTIVPFRNDVYYENRPQINIPKSQVIRNHDDMGFNPALSSLQPIFEEGLMTIINEVGYPNPDRSHFRSMDIWHTASNPDERLEYGWLGRYLDSDCIGCEVPYHCIEIGDHVSLANHGYRRDALAMRGPATLERAAGNDFLKELGNQYQEHGDPQLNFLYKTMIDVQESATYLTQQARAYRSPYDYPNHAFGEGMRQIAELIIADTNTQVYYISLPGFDTHVNQKARQHQLLTIYAEAMQTFIKDLRLNSLFDDVLMLTFSEFGRRVRENQSQGTDHGAANSIFLMGNKLSVPGYFNAAPNLASLDAGDLSYKVDFRSIYAQVLDHWLGANSMQILGNTSPLALRLF